MIKYQFRYLLSGIKNNNIYLNSELEKSIVIIDNIKRIIETNSRIAGKRGCINLKNEMIIISR